MNKLIGIFTMLVATALFAGPSFSADTANNMKADKNTHYATKADQNQNYNEKAANSRAFLAQPERFKDIEKTEVLSTDNKRLGKFEDFIVDKSGKISYLLFKHGVFGGTVIPVPWDFAVKHMNYDPNKKEYVLNITKDELDKAPNFKDQDLRNFGSDQFKNVNDYYSKLGSDDRAHRAAR